MFGFRRSLGLPLQITTRCVYFGRRAKVDGFRGLVGTFTRVHGSGPVSDRYPDLLCPGGTEERGPPDTNPTYPVTR